MIEILLIAISLSLDAFSVAVSCGLSNKKLKVWNQIIIAISFGLFQAIMPLAGYIGGSLIRQFITNIDHWIAFIILGYIGFKMIVNASSNKKKKPIDLTKPKILLALSIATSIDALIIGIGFSFTYINIVNACLIIGVITFLISYMGIKGGVFLKNLITISRLKFVEIGGGLILILIGLRILLSHLFG